MAHRKLQQEVDKVFKKISEGLESFEIYYERHELSNNQTQRDKLENDMKKEIKKLQRLREQIKVWQSTNDVKDKDKLLKFRKLVETEMEKYKQVEKFSKQKAYSKEVLNQPEKLSPQDEFRLSIILYIQSVLEKLQMLQESIEADISKLTGSLSSGSSSNSKKRRNNHNSGLPLKDQEKRQELVDSIERIEFHQKYLELILRQLENDDLTFTTDQFNTLKDDLEYFLEMNLEPDFMFDDSIYEYLNLEKDIDAENVDSNTATPISSSNNSNILPSIPSQKQNSSSKENTPPSTKSPQKSLVPNEIHSNKPQRGSENDKSKNEIYEKLKVRESIDKPRMQEDNTEILNIQGQNEKFLQQDNVKIQLSEKQQHDNAKPQLSEKQQQNSWASFTADLHNHKNSPPNSAPVSGINNNNFHTEHINDRYSNVNNNYSGGTMVDQENELYKSDQINMITGSVPDTAVSQLSFSNNGISEQDFLFSLKDKFDFSKIGYLARFDKPIIYSSISKTNNHDENTNLSESEILLLQDSSMVSLPSGIQMFIDSFVQSNNSPKDAFNYKNANDMLLDSRCFSIITLSSSIPIQTSEFQKLSTLWDTIKLSAHNELQFLRLDPVTLFFGFYFGLSQAEKRLAMSLLYLKNWRLKNDQISWFLKIDNNKNSETGENLGIFNFEVFNAFSWSASIVYNYKLDSESIIKI